MGGWIAICFCKYAAEAAAVAAGRTNIGPGKYMACGRRPAGSGLPATAPNNHHQFHKEERGGPAR